MKSLIRLLAMPLAIVLPIAALVVLPTMSSAAVPRSPDRPNVKIEGTPGEFVPQAIRVKGVTGPACTPQHYSFRITNKTSVDQQVEYNGAAFGSPIPPKGHIPVCDEDGVNFTMGLASNPDAVLTVTG